MNNDTAILHIEMKNESDYKVHIDSTRRNLCIMLAALIYHDEDFREIFKTAINLQQEVQEEREKRKNIKKSEVFLDDDEQKNY